jgi:uncharacterized protein (TIGR03083 family)
MTTVVPPPNMAAIVDAIDRRTTDIVDTLRSLDDEALSAPSLLPEWSVLTIACHLRYGADALIRLTDAAPRGAAAAYYPEGRAAQRPGTLVPAPGESAAHVVASLDRAAAGLTARWRELDASAWTLTVDEPPGQADLGDLPLHLLAVLRLTEVEVHGTDLGLGLADWSDLFVRTALPSRLARCNSRRSNHRAFDTTVDGSWLLAPDDAPAYLVAVAGERVAARPAEAGTAARAVIAGSSRDLLALVLGRPPRHELRLSGDVAFARQFSRALPGP